MDHLTQSLSMPDVDLEIRDRFRLLRFRPALEKKFEADVAKDRCKHLILHNYIGIIIYHCFLYSDYKAVGDAFMVDLVMHFLVMTPVLLIANSLLSRHPAAWMREGLEVLALIILAVSIVAVVASSAAPDKEIVHLSVVLVVLFAIVMQRIRFWYVLPACLIIQAIYSLGMALFIPVSMDRALMANSVFFGIAVFSLIGAYNLEHEQRMGYLLRLRERWRNDELEITSLKDPLTGLGNRRAMDADFEQLLTDESRQGNPIAVLLIDIDHFKLFNDKNGHQQGDVCLKQVSGLIAASLTGVAGSAYRFGGEEFLVLLSDAGLGNAMAIGERIRANVARASIARDGMRETFVTISVGVASGSLAAGSAEGLIADADVALYSAKTRGRNQVAVSVEGSRIAPSRAADRSDLSAA